MPEVSCAIRNTGTGWEVISDTGHTPVGVSSVSTFSDRIEVNLNFTASKVLSADVTTDETLSRLGTIAGASVGLNKIIVHLTNVSGLYDYVYWDTTLNGGTGGWKSFKNVFTFPVFSGSGPTSLSPTYGLRLGHPTVSIEEGMAAVASGRGTTHRVGVGSLGAGSLDIQFYDNSGVLRTTPDANMKVYVSRPGPVPVNPQALVEPYGNIWITGHYIK